MAAILQHRQPLELPPELRLMIYKFYLIPPAFNSASSSPTFSSDADPMTRLDISDLKMKSTISHTCRFMRNDAMQPFHALVEVGVQYWLKAISESQQQILNSYRQNAGSRLCTNWDPVVVKMELQQWLEGMQQIEQLGATI